MEFTEDGRGRLGMSVHTIDYFEKVTPFEGEIAYDPKTYDIYIYHQGEARWEKYSKTAEIQDRLDDLDKSGVFTSASAFVNNRKIYRFYFDQTNGTVRLDPELRFEEIYEYYAIRKTELTPGGGYIYITGSRDGDTGINSSLVNMELVDSESGDGTKVRKPAVGGLVEEVTNGGTYVVEFFDKTFQLLNMQTYQAIAVRTADLDLSPDTAITDMYVQSNQNYTGVKDAIYMYRHQNPGAVQISTMLKYADGLTRDISHEENGRLSIVGLDDINTSEVTPSGGTPQSISVVYTMIRSNASMPPSTQETETGATISPISLTISRDIAVYIVEDTNDIIEKIIPVGYIVPDGIGKYKIQMKYFGFYRSGKINDVTTIAHYTDKQHTLVENLFTRQDLWVAVPYGHGTDEKVIKFAIIPHEYNDNTTNAVQIQLEGEGSAEPTRFLTYDPTATGGSADHSGKFINFQSDEGEAGQIIQVPVSALLVLDDVNFDNHAPTHVRIRDVIDSSYIYTDIVEAKDSDGIFYDSYGGGHEMRPDRPLLVEFFQIVKDDDVAVSVFSTGALLHYAKQYSK